MNDPHVDHIRYRVTSPDGDDFSRAVALEIERDGFRISLHGETLLFFPTEHFGRAEDAITYARRPLLAWAAAMDLDPRYGRLTFDYERAAIVDRSPQPGSLGAISAHSSASASASARATVVRRTFPPYPHQMEATPDFETMYLRWKAYVEGREPLLSMSYMCLTVLEAPFPKSRRKSAARSYGVEFEVLDTLAHLASAFGGPTSARKVTAKGFRELSESQRVWLERVIPELISRVGRASIDPQLHSRPLTMADLPQLKG